MKKELPDKKEPMLTHYRKSIKYSLEGLLSAFLSERSFHLYFLCAILVISLSFLLQISKYDAIIVSIILILILAMELINTAIESVVDMVMKEYHPYAKRAKDCAASATFVLVVLGIALGFVIFIPYMK